MLIGIEFKPFIIKSYPHWDLVLSEKQYYVGRCYAWWKDRAPSEGEGLRPSKIIALARDELYQQVFEDVIKACKALGYSVEPYGKDFLLNEVYLANEEVHRHHLHYHFIPRTKHPFEVRGMTGFKMDDTQWGSNYAGFDRRISPNDMFVLKQTMGLALC